MKILPFASALFMPAKWNLRRKKTDGFKMKKNSLRIISRRYHSVNRRLTTAF
ncbi:hypothetical protein BH11BAC1_BH11BAC1_03130 [soil metagenome]